MKLVIQDGIFLPENTTYQKSHPRECGDPEKRLDSRFRGNDKPIYAKCIGILVILFYLYSSIFFTSYSLTFEKDFNADKVMARSKYIILAEVEEKEIIYVHGLPITRVTYKILESYKGDLKNGDSITVGQLNNKSYDPYFPNQDNSGRAILFLVTKSNDGDFILTGFHKGFVPLEKEDKEWKIPKRFFKNFSTIFHSDLNKDCRVTNFMKKFKKGVAKANNEANR